MLNASTEPGLQTDSLFPVVSPAVPPTVSPRVSPDVSIVVSSTVPVNNGSNLAGRLMLMALGLALSGCAPGLVPSTGGGVGNGADRAPAAAPEAPVASPAAPVVPRTLSLATMVPAERYVVQVTAEILWDSAGHRESGLVSASANVLLEIEREAKLIRGTGVVDSFVVSTGLPTGGRANSAGGGSGGDSFRDSTGAGSTDRSTQGNTESEALSTPIEFLVDTAQLRVAARPPFPNECENPGAAATYFVRDFLFRLPMELSVGMRWSDSTISFACRDGIPVTTRVASSYVVERITLENGRPVALITRTTTTSVEGASMMSWRTRRVHGTGTGNQLFTIDGTTGALIGLNGTSVLSLEADMATIRQTSTQQLRRKQ